MEKLPLYYFSWIASSQKQRLHICDMPPLETKQSGVKLLPHSDLQERVFLEEMSHSRHYNKEEYKEQNEHHSYKIGTWKIGL